MVIWFMNVYDTYNKLVATWGETVAQQTFRIFALHIEPIRGPSKPQNTEVLSHVIIKHAGIAT
jgi:hypothetical protein